MDVYRTVPIDESTMNPEMIKMLAGPQGFSGSAKMVPIIVEICPIQVYYKIKFFKTAILLCHDARDQSCSSLSGMFDGR